MDATLAALQPDGSGIAALSAGFSPADWAVLAAYGAVLIGSGWWFSRKPPDNAKSYFLADRSMPAWAVAVSILATAQSAATFVGVPQSSFLGNWSYLLTNLGPVIAAFIVVKFFLPAYFKLNVGTPYELLETRFGPGARLASSWAYLVGRTLAAGARTFIGALPLSLAMFGDSSPEHMTWSIAAIMAVGILYTFVGGISSVIWTDVLQVAVYLGAAIAALFVLLGKVQAPWPEVFEAFRTTSVDNAAGDKLTVIDWGVPFSLSTDTTVLTVLSGWMLLNLAAYSVDQDLVQRMLTCKSPREAAKSLLASTAVAVPVAILFLTIGSLLWLYYFRPDLTGGTTTPRVLPESKDVFQRFILNEMPPGLRGLMIAGVLAIGPAGINATLNSMASTFINDTYKRFAPNASDRHQVLVGRAAVIASGIALALTAIACVYWQRHSNQSLISFAMAIMSFAYAGLLGVFLVALFSRAGTTLSSILGLLTGLLVTAAFDPLLFKQWAPHIPLRNETTLASITIAFPWRFVLATTAAFLVTLSLSHPKTKPNHQP
jgi:SSS family transporter